MSTCSFTVTIHPTPILDLAPTDVSCFGFADGMIDLTVTNGTAPYDYDWSNGAEIEDISGLQPGLYSVTVTDVNGCSASAEIMISQPDQLVLNKLVSDVSCHGGSDGLIDLTVSGGVQPYNFQWNTGPTSEDLSGLSIGTYTVTIRDANECEISNTTVIHEPDSLLIQHSVTGATCNAANGSVNVQVTGGVTPYSYDWSNGSGNANLTNVVGGTYTLIVTDANQCTATLTVEVPSGSNLEGYVITNDVTCYRGGNGSATVIVEDGNAPFEFLWAGGETDNSIENLTAGEYWVMVTDVFGCQMTINFDINEPHELILELSSPEQIEGFNVSTYEGSDGVIISEVSGGTPDYTYQWSSGGASPSVGGVEAGVHTVIVTDANGCVVTGSIELNQPYELGNARRDFTEWRWSK